MNIANLTTLICAQQIASRRAIGTSIPEPILIVGLLFLTALFVFSIIKIVRLYRI